MAQQIARSLAGAIALAIVVACGRVADASLRPAPTPLGLPPAGDRWGDLTWTHTDVEPGPGGNVRLTVAATSEAGLVALGNDEDAVRDTFVMLSADGSVWRRADPPIPEVEFTDITVIDHRYVAVGDAEPGPGGAARVAVHTSEDGRVWRPTGDRATFADAYVLGVASGPGGLIASGVSADGEPVLWRSPEGLGWTRHTPADLGLGDVAIESIAAGPSGWLAAGRSPDRALAITSVDGAAWTASELAAGRPGRNWESIVTTAIDGGAGRLLTGIEVQECGFLWWEGDCAGSAAAWWADRSGSWAPLPLEGSPLAQWPVVAGDEHGFVAATGLGVFASADGQRWAPVTSIDPGAQATPSDVVVAVDRIVVVGSRTLPTGRQVGWIAVGAP